MTNRSGLIPIIGVLAMLLAPALASAAGEPAATAVIPPPAPPVAVQKAAPPSSVHKAPTAAKTAGVGHAKRQHIAAAKKKDTRTAAASPTTTGHKPDAVSQRHARHHTTTERRRFVARAAPQLPAGPPRGYAGVPMLAPDGPPPPLPPPWYDRARPAVAFAYPGPFMGPRGPMPWWVR